MAFGGFLKQSTAVDILIGPFVDSVDGMTAETGLTLDVELSKNGQALANKNEGTTPTHDAAGTVDGYYNCVFDTTDTNTVGQLTVVAHDSGALPVRLDFQVIDTVPFDELFKDAATGVQGVIETNNLDHLLKVTTGVAADGDLSNHVVDQTVMSHLLTATADTDKFKASTDSLEAIKVHADTIKAETASIQTETTALDTLTKASGDGDLAAVLADTNELQTDDIPGSLATAQSDLDIITGASGVVLQDGTITAATIAAAAIDNATFAADVGSTAYASNIIALAVRKVLDELNLDHLMKVAVADRDTLAEVVDDTVLANIMTKTDGDTSDFDHATDSLEATRDTASGDRFVHHHSVIKEAKTDVTLRVLLKDASGDPKTSQTITDLDMYYIRVETDNDVTISSKVDLTALTALTDAHADNKAYEIGQGYYRIDVPDAAFATGAYRGTVIIKDGAGTILPTMIDFELVDHIQLQSGALEITYTVKEDDEDTGDPIDGVEVWITTDEAGTNVIWSGTTDANGVLKETGDSKPFLDAGTYYFWRRKSGYSFTNPDTETFS